MNNKTDKPIKPIAEDGPFLILESGRENLPVEERVALLKQDMRSLQKPPLVEGIGRFDGINGSNIHAYNELRSRVHAYEHFLNRMKEKGEKPPEDWTSLSHAECHAMAWKRGGVEEYRRIYNERKRYYDKEVIIARKRKKDPTWQWPTKRGK